MLAKGRRFDQLEQDWRSGRLSSHELEEALQGYGRTIIACLDEDLHLAEIYPLKGQKVVPG